MSHSKQPTSQCTKRLEIELRKLNGDPAEFIKATPDPNNILEWYYLVDGPPGTPYEGGTYLGMLTFPPTYPFAPPSIRMITPSGRFEPNKRLCLSISDYHPESWNPIWGVKSILVGLLSFMVGSDETLGSMQTSTTVRKEFASKSDAFNLKQAKFVELFPQDAEKARKTRKRDRED